MKQLEEASNSIVSVPGSFIYLIKNSWLWKYILIPMVINFFLFLVIWLGTYRLIQQLLISRTNFENTVYNLDAVGFVFLFFLVAILAAFITYIFASSVAAPFNGMMVVKILEKEQNKINIQRNSIKLFLKQILRSLAFEVIKIILLLVLFIGAYMFGIIPIIGAVLAAGMTFIGNAYLQTLDFYDPVFEEYKYSLKEKFLYLGKNFYINSGFLVVTGIIVLIPFINIMFIPLGVLNATRIFLTLES